MKKNKGITLIALIITIVIMLILVAVTISILINSGLISKAKEAGKKTKSAYEIESRTGESIIVNGVEYSGIDDYLEEISNEGIEENHNWVRGTGNSIDDFTCTCDVCTNNGENPAGRTLTIGQRVNYRDRGTGTSTISAEMSGIAQAKEDGENFANRFGESQTINKDTNTVWVVLGSEDNNNDGRYETLLLTTKTPTEDEIWLYGAAGYNNWISECNRIAKDLYGNNARGMTIEDVNRCFRYTPIGGMYCDSNGVFQTTGNLTTKLRELPVWNDLKEYGTFTPDGTNTEAALGNYALDGYVYTTWIDEDIWYITNEVDQSNITHTVTEAEGNVISDITMDEVNYWLASHSVIIEGSYANFGPGAVFLGQFYSCFGLFDSYGTTNNYNMHFRAVVSLTSRIPSPVT